MLLLTLSTAFAGAPDLGHAVRTGARADEDAAVVVGLEDYFVLPDVPYARADAQAFADFLIYTRGLSKSRVAMLSGSPVKEQILAAVDKAAVSAGQGGTVWVYFAGHGAASPSTGERVLLGADVQADVNVFDARAVSVDTLHERATSGGSQAIFVMDACYTGRTRDGEELVAGKRFAVPTYATVAKPRVLDWSAAGPGEWSAPLEGVGHGAFTYAVLGALRGWADGQRDGQRDGVVTAEEADLFVGELLAELQVHDQHPVMSTESAREWTLSPGTEVRPGTEPPPAAEAPVAVQTPAPAPGPAPAPAPAAAPEPAAAVVAPKPEPVHPDCPAYYAGCGGELAGHWAQDTVGDSAVDGCSADSWIKTVLVKSFTFHTDDTVSHVNSVDQDWVRDKECMKADKYLNCKDFDQLDTQDCASVKGVCTCISHSEYGSFSRRSYTNDNGVLTVEGLDKPLCTCKRDGKLTVYDANTTAGYLFESRSLGQ